MTKAKKSSIKTKKEKITDLKTETTEQNTVKKGYNEKNPTEPQGAFKPDTAG